MPLLIIPKKLIGSHSLLASVAALLLVGAVCAQGPTPSNVRQGLMVSEVFHDSSPHNPGNLSSYVEITNSCHLQPPHADSWTLFADREHRDHVVL